MASTMMMIRTIVPIPIYMITSSPEKPLATRRAWPKRWTAWPAGDAGMRRRDDLAGSIAWGAGQYRAGHITIRTGAAVTSRRPSVVVLDYGSGNLRSAQRALQRAGADAEVSADADAALRRRRAGRAGRGRVRRLHGRACGRPAATRSSPSGWPARRPVLGICVGMQVLFAPGDEHGETTAGVGCWPGVVQKLTAPVLPHMGWNVVSRPRPPACSPGIDADAMFYFVHSYAATQPPRPARRARAAADRLDHARRGLRRRWWRTAR